MIGAELGGRYRILAKLGEGGMGEVYLAEHVHLRRKEAIKVLQPELAASPEFVARLRREARATNRLQHRNIVAVHDFGQLPDGRFYLATEYAPGRTLKQALRSLGPMPVERALGTMGQLADAIDHAHSRGVIHRDLKPQNLILVDNSFGHDLLKVLDFGMSKIVAPEYVDSVGITDRDAIYGTPAYMSPEQCRGVGDDSRIDIYALGCIAFEALVGEPPFRGHIAQLMNEHLTKEPAAPSARRPEVEVPHELDAIVLRCLEKDPERRFPRGRDLLAALRRVPGFPEEATRSARHSFRAVPAGVLPEVPSPGGFEEQETHEGDRSGALALASTIPAGKAAVTRGGDTAQMYRGALREFAETLVDLGAQDVQLTVHLTDFAALESELDQWDEELRTLDQELDRGESRAREREASIRFSIGELCFERDAVVTSERQRNHEFDAQISALEDRLHVVAAERDERIRNITDRAVAVVAQRQPIIERVAGLCEELDAEVEQVRPRFSHLRLVRELARRLDAARLRVAAD